MINIRSFNKNDIEPASELVAKFRVELSDLKGIQKEPNNALGREELEEYIKCNFPMFVAEDGDKIILGYLVCRIDGNVIWAESLYVLPEYRRKGIASLLYSEAEKIAINLECETVYNWVHPNNDRIINFLKKKGYDVLNLIEVRKPWPGEQIKRKIMVDKHEFNY